MVIRIAIIGTGRLGTRLAEQIVTDGVCDELYLSNRCTQRLSGTLLSLNIWSKLLQKKTKISILDLKDINLMNVIIIAIKENYDPRTVIRNASFPSWLPHNLRYAGIALDLPLLKQTCDALKGFSGKVVMVTNPVEIMSSFAAIWLPTANVFGAGLTLDAARFSFVVYKNYGLNISLYDCLLGGEHGNKLIPLKSIWNVDKKIESQEDINTCLSQVSGIGFQIVNNLGYTLQDCAVIFSQDISWLLGLNTTNLLSVFSIWDESVCVGMPIMLSYEKNKLIKYEGITDKERNDIKNTRDCIEKYFELINKHYLYKVS